MGEGSAAGRQLGVEQSASIRLLDELMEVTIGNISTFKASKPTSSNGSAQRKRRAQVPEL
jgi:hypothetical protein